MQKSSYQLITVILCLALASIGLFMGCGSSSDSGTAGAYQENSTSAAVQIKYQFAALHSPDHPIITALQNKGVNLNVVSEDLQAKREALIVNGSEMTAGDLEANETIKAYLQSGKGLLVLNATGAHKKALIRHVGMAYGTHDTRGYFVIAVPSSAGREFAIYECPSRVTFDAANFKDSAGNIIDTAAHEAWQSVIQDQVDSTVGPKHLAENIVSQMEENRAIRAGTKSRESIPAGLKSCIWRIPNDTQSWGLQNAWVSGYPKTVWYYPAWEPAKGYQTGTFGHTTMVSLYLDNRPENQGDNYQWLAVDFQGWNEEQSGPNSTYEKKHTYKMPMEGENHNVMNSDNYEMDGFGWGLMKYCMFFVPTGSTAGIKNYSAQPETENSSSSYTSGYNFSVGFSPMGGASGNFSVTNSRTTNQKDWVVAVQTDLSKPSYGWEWRSNNPSWDGNKASHMNDINLGTFQPCSCAVMITDSIISDTRSFSFTYGATLLSVRAYYHSGGAKDYYKYDLTPATRNCTVTIDFSKVLYPIAQQLTISPAYPAQVMGGNNASGTINIDQAAPAGGATVSLSSSNTAWATVPDMVTIPEGASSASFTITTKPVTTDSTATISATLNYVKVTGNLAIKAQ
ncbi:MAG: hypothetical protein AB9903_18015 [Vulcanimicrobiota bacterium]